VFGSCNVFAVLIAFSTDIGEFRTFQTINYALRNAGQSFREGQAGSSSTHRINGVDEQLAARSTQFHAFQIFRAGNNFVGNQVTETKYIVQSQNFDALLLCFCNHILNEGSFDHLCIFIIGLVHHRTNQRLEVRNIVTQVRRILNGDEVCTISYLLQAILVASQLVLTIALNLNTTLSFLFNTTSNQLHGFVELLVRREYVAELQNNFLVSSCILFLFFFVAAAAN